MKKHESTDGLYLLGLMIMLVLFFLLFFLRVDVNRVTEWKKHIEMCDRYNGMDLREVPKYCWPEGARTE